MGPNRRNIENTNLSLSEILPVYFADRPYMTVAAAGDKYCIFGLFRGRSKLITICGKPAAPVLLFIILTMPTDHSVP